MEVLLQCWHIFACSIKTIPFWYHCMQQKK
uniref:Uncharacterized protein n=1 Tax=Arundo donax TaxID=35708 RepID=A0A0A9CIJ4_ARUDO